MMRAIHLLLSLSCLIFAFASVAKPVKVAILIDDMGYRATDELAFQLPHTVSFAVLPFTAQSQYFVQRARTENRQVLLHMPMEPLSQDVPLSEGTLMTTMNAEVLAQQFARALQSVGPVLGVNNHMGSKLTQDEATMSYVLELIQQAGIFFVDSVTIADSLAYEIARNKGIKTARRQVFLDHEPSEQFMQQQFHKMLRIAQRDGHVIAIAHPYPETLPWLIQALQELDPEVYQLVPISEVLE